MVSCRQIAERCIAELKPPPTMRARSLNSFQMQERRLDLLQERGRWLLNEVATAGQLGLRLHQPSHLALAPLLARVKCALDPLTFRLDVLPVLLRLGLPRFGRIEQLLRLSDLLVRLGCLELKVIYFRLQRSYGCKGRLFLLVELCKCLGLCRLGGFDLLLRVFFEKSKDGHDAA